MAKRSEMTWLRRGEVWLIFFGVMTMLSACSKGERARKMETELESIVSRGIKVGASRIEVEAFIDRLVVDGIKPTRGQFQENLSQLGSPEMPHKPKKNLAEIKGYVLADFGTVDSDATVMHYVGLHALFFLDKQDRLLESGVYRTFRH